MEKIRHLRWYILGFVFIATIINYLDRMAWNCTQPVIGKLYHMDNAHLALIVLSFQLAYTFGPIPMGWLMDRMGTRRGYSLSMFIWCSAGVLTAFALPIGEGIKSILPISGLSIIVGFAFCRFILGVGESANFPVAIKAMSEWFPTKERSLAIGSFNTGSSIGAMVSPMVCAWLYLAYGWQAMFVIVGSIGFLWIIGWMKIYRRPSEHPRITQEELAYIQDSRTDEKPAVEARKLSYLEVIKIRQVWGVLLMRTFAEQVWWFCQTWLPTYFFQDRGLDLKKMAFFVMLSFVMADVGNVFGGWTSSTLIKRGWSINAARKTVMVPCGLLMMSAAIVPFVSIYPAVLLISMVTFCYTSWSANQLTIPTDVVPKSAVGSAAGLAHVSAGAGGMIITALTGLITTRYHSFTPIFVLIGIVPLIAVIMLFVAVGRIAPYQKGGLPEAEKESVKEVCL
ncbi:MAG: MFS transporter [Armatimonadetes bacterium]|nr:MFS transporter [Armatimonadota bacterium]